MEIHAVLCGSINRVTLRTLIEHGIKVFGTEARSAVQAITQDDNGELEAVATGHGANEAQGGGGCCGGHDFGCGAAAEQ